MRKISPAQPPPILHGRTSIIQLTGTSAQGLRHLESKGHVSPIRDSYGKRLYTEADVRALQIYQAAREVVGPKTSCEMTCTPPHADLSVPRSQVCIVATFLEC